LRQLPAAQAAPFIDAYADAIGYVFLWVVPVALVGFVISWFLKEVPLRDSARAGASDMGEGFAAPDSPDAVKQLERAIAGVMRHAKAETPVSAQILSDSGSLLTPAQAWALGQIHWRTRLQGGASIAAVAQAHRMPAEVLQPAFAEVVRSGYATYDPTADHLDLTPAGQAELNRLHAAWRRWLDTRLDDWTVTDPTDRALLDRAINNIAAKLLEEEETNRERTAV
jgi:hypothetical protein